MVAHGLGIDASVEGAAFQVLGDWRWHECADRVDQYFQLKNQKWLPPVAYRKQAIDVRV